MPVVPGRLRHRVTLVRVVERDRGPSGQAVPSYEDVEARWARVEDMSAGLTFKAAAAGSRARTMVTVREPFAADPIVSSFRFEERGRLRMLNIVEIRRRPESDYVECFCVEVA